MEGLRAGEAVGLRWRDLNGDVAQVRGKGGKYRKIVLSRLLCGILDATPRTDERILGYGYQNLLLKMQRLGRLARIAHVHPHLLRHSWASQSLIIGMDSETLRALGGWSASSQVVQRYIESAREQAALLRSRELGITEQLLGG